MLVNIANKGERNQAVEMFFFGCCRRITTHQNNGLAGLHGFHRLAAAFRLIRSLDMISLVQSYRSFSKKGLIVL